MSVGLIYRYFSSKDELVLSLCERIYADFIADVIGPRDPSFSSARDFQSSFASRIPDLIDQDRAALIVEVLAEAGRNPKVDEITVCIDDQFRLALGPIVKASDEALDDDAVTARVEMIITMVRGLALHVAIHPKVDLKIIAQDLERALNAVLAPPRTPSN